MLGLLRCSLAEAGERSETQQQKAFVPTQADVGREWKPLADAQSVCFMVPT